MNASGKILSVADCNQVDHVIKHAQPLLSGSILPRVLSVADCNGRASDALLLIPSYFSLVLNHNGKQFEFSSSIVIIALHL